MFTIAFIIATKFAAVNNRCGLGSSKHGCETSVCRLSCALRVNSAGGHSVPPGRSQAGEERRGAARLQSAPSQISDFVQNFQRDLLFSIDEQSDQVVVKVIDSHTQKVIRLISPRRATALR